jgi:hypothetical protein
MFDPNLALNVKFFRTEGVLTKQREKEPLQKYIKSFAKARAKAPHVQATTIINAAIDGLKVGSFGEYVDRRRPMSGFSTIGQ